MTDGDYEYLLSELKNYLDITWEDAQMDRKLMGMMKRGAASIASKIGECDFLTETPEKALLFQYVMYEQAGESDKFWQNYRSEVLSLQLSRKVESYAES